MNFITLIKPVYAADLGKNYAFSSFNSFGDVISRLLPVAFSIAGIILVFFILFAAFKYLTSGGDKNALSSAQAMITHTIIGFLLLMVTFLVVKFIFQVFGLNFNFL